MTSAAEIVLILLLLNHLECKEKNSGKARIQSETLHKNNGLLH